jgi:6-pyruvoyltetrahydropterin/6-carboxytetrahydropterin synthase
LCNIKVLDQVLREIVVRDVISQLHEQTAEQLVRAIYCTLIERWQDASEIDSLTLAVSPYLSYQIDADEKTTTMISMTQQFEFSAAHRLHCSTLSDEENLALFGKCNNPEGHGHNYVVEITVKGNVNAGRQLLDLPQFESAVKRSIIDRLDHKHLNRDVAHFANTNPSVENIAIAIWNWLLEGLKGLADIQLQAVRVYETPKTWAEYQGDS